MDTFKAGDRVVVNRNMMGTIVKKSQVQYRDTPGTDYAVRLDGSGKVIRVNSTAIERAEDPSH